MTKEYKIAILHDNHYYLIGTRSNVDFQRRFPNITELLNFAIQDSWEELREGFSFKPFKNSPDAKLELPEYECELVQRLSQAYQTLEKDYKYAQDMNRILRANLEKTTETLKREREIRQQIEQRT